MAGVCSDSSSAANDRFSLSSEACEGFTKRKLTLLAADTQEEDYHVEQSAMGSIDGYVDKCYQTKWAFESFGRNDQGDYDESTSIVYYVEDGSTPFDRVRISNSRPNWHKEDRYKVCNKWEIPSPGFQGELSQWRSRKSFSSSGSGFVQQVKVSISAEPNGGWETAIDWSPVGEVDTVLDVPTGSFSASVDWRPNSGWWKTSTTGMNFKYFGSAMSWSAAEEFCVSIGAHLATIGSDEENQIVLELVQSHMTRPSPPPYTMIGLHYTRQTNSDDFVDRCATSLPVPEAGTMQWIGTGSRNTRSGIGYQNWINFGVYCPYSEENGYDEKELGTFITMMDLSGMWTLVDPSRANEWPTSFVCNKPRK
jgi:hypothetical protein